MVAEGHGRPAPAGPPAAPHQRALTAVRLAVPADAAAVAALLQSAAADGTLGRDAADFGEADVFRWLSGTDLRVACTLVVTVAGEVRGVALATRGAARVLAHVATVALAVDGRERRCGLGRLLLGGLAAWAGAAGVVKLTAGVCRGNAAALALFHAAGYRVEGVRRRQFWVDAGWEDEVLFGRFCDAAAASATGGD